MASSWDLPFQWGAASAAYQIEGAASEDGKADSIWDEYCRIPGSIDDGSNADIACDFYHKYKEDIALVKDAGFKYFRMSISWPRVIQDDGQENEKGIAFYERVFEALREADLTPCVTLYHWDLPASLQKSLGGWMNEEIVGKFVDFSRLCFKRFAKYVPVWITFNEPAVFVFGGYQGGWNAPGVKQTVGEALLAMRHVLLAHVASVELYRSEFQAECKGGKIGITINTRHYVAMDESEAAAKGAQVMLEGRIACWSDPVILGDFPEIFKKQHPDNPALQLDDALRQRLKNSTDFLGINYYTTSGVVANEASGAGAYKIIEVGEASGAGWLRSYPKGLEQLLQWLSERYSGLPVIITENGFCTDSNGPQPCEDEVRVKYSLFFSCLW
eukprot:TRINITY_DN18237_c0_g1_i1.p1 TRINITY_DN18237_c0_g1~~TRINITY_DN18237_c0_g1_i1.p1  ORF type:complete len:399 (-),score=64.45 TRINITY_DN18237_c0_g1_i1:87-1244(-)